MFAEARLVTPNGKTIIPSVTDYEKVVDILALPMSQPRPSLREARELILQLRGKYASGRSLTEALLDERRKERQREES